MNYYEILYIVNPNFERKKIDDEEARLMEEEFERIEAEKERAEYLEKLNIYYENWIKKHPQENVLTIDLSENDFIEDPKFLKKIYSMIEKKINELT